MNVKMTGLLGVLVLFSDSGLAAAAQDGTLRDSASAGQSLPPHVRSAISEREIMVGMTKQQVLASWGPPCRSCDGTSESAWGDTWEYNAFDSSSRTYAHGILLFFDPNGVLQAWTR